MELDDMLVNFDPEYQNNLFKIESALQSVGALEGPENELPNIFDEQLRLLIDSVPLD